MTYFSLKSVPTGRLQRTTCGETACFKREKSQGDSFRNIWQHLESNSSFFNQHSKRKSNRISTGKDRRLSDWKRVSTIQFRAAQKNSKDGHFGLSQSPFRGGYSERKLPDRAVGVDYRVQKCLGMYRLVTSCSAAAVARGLASTLCGIPGLMDGGSRSHRPW